MYIQVGTSSDIIIEVALYLFRNAEVSIIPFYKEM